MAPLLRVLRRGSVSDLSFSHHKIGEVVQSPPSPPPLWYVWKKSVTTPLPPKQHMTNPGWSLELELELELGSALVSDIPESYTRCT